MDSRGVLGRAAQDRDAPLRNVFAKAGVNSRGDLAQIHPS
jgi:hypothetical protein